MELTETHTKEINTHNGLFRTNGYKHFRLHFFAREERGKGGSGRGDEGARGREILVHFLCSQNEKDSRNQALAHATYTMSIMCKRIEFQCHIKLS